MEAQRNHRRTGLNDDLFIKRMPLVIKELISREAAQNHRSVNQEAIALLEEALLHRVETRHTHRRSALATLASYAAESDSPPPLRAVPSTQQSSSGG
jgi:hypothetical protein